MQSGVEASPIVVNVEGDPEPPGGEAAGEGETGGAEGGEGKKDLERGRASGPTLAQLYQQFIGKPAVHRIVRPLQQHPLVAAPAPVSFVEER